MHGGDDGDAALVEPAQQGDQFDLAADVEVLRGLVEQHQLGLLSQADGDLHPLALAARQLRVRPVDAVRTMSTASIAFSTAS